MATINIMVVAKGRQAAALSSQEWSLYVPDLASFSAAGVLTAASHHIDRGRTGPSGPMVVHIHTLLSLLDTQNTCLCTHNTYSLHTYTIINNNEIE